MATRPLPGKKRRTTRLPLLNSISRIALLLITPVAFRALNFAFIWHSIYWGAITLVVLVWALLVLVSPLVGRIGCGWICFMGTIQDLVSEHALYPIRWRKPLLWLRLACLAVFLTTGFTFFFLRLETGRIHGVTFSPMLLSMDFDTHYKLVWIYDAAGAVLLGLLLERRWICRNACFMGLLCAGGASFSRLIPVVDTERCNLCGVCEDACPVRIPIRDYVVGRKGLVTNPECLICGKCDVSCRKDAVRIRFVWNRRSGPQGSRPRGHCHDLISENGRDSPA